MKKKRLNRNSRKLLMIILAVLLVLGGLFFWLNHHSRPDYSKGMAYLNSLEERSGQDISAKLADKKRARLMQDIAEGKRNIFALFSDAVIFGDSRAKGFEEYGFLPDDQVNAQVGGQVTTISDFVDQTAQMKPKTVYFTYGLNDLESNVGYAIGQNGYGSVYEEQIRKIVEKIPDAQIVVATILPVSAEAGIAPERIEMYNQEIRDMAARNGWTVAESASLDPSSYYDGDGIHFDSSFYPVWAANLFEATQGQGGSNG